jgi:hypothetical protein
VFEGDEAWLEAGIIGLGVEADALRPRPFVKDSGENAPISSAPPSEEDAAASSGAARASRSDQAGAGAGR